MKKISILLTAFMVTTLFAFSGCDLLNNSVIQEGVFVVEEEPEPEPIVIELPTPDQEESVEIVWEHRFATKPMAFGFANNDGSKLIYVLYGYDGPGSDEDEEPATTETESYVGDYDEDEDDGFIPNNFLEETGFDPDRYTLAVGPYGSLWPINFSKWQDETPQNNNRENSNNFKNLPGFIFVQKGWKLSKNTTHLLTDMDTLIDSMLAISPPGWRGNTPPMEDETVESIEKHKERKVAWTKTLAVTPDESLIGLVLFEREGNDMLFSIVYMSEDKTLFWDNHAVYDEDSTWRVDAGEEPGSFEPLVLARFDEGLMLMLTWNAPGEELAITLYENEGVFVQAEGLTSVRNMP